jgi:hypothetical protein
VLELVPAISIIHDTRSESVVHFSVDDSFSQQQLVTFEQKQLINWGQAFPSNFYEFRFPIIV